MRGNRAALGLLVVLPVLLGGLTGPARVADQAGQQTRTLVTTESDCYQFDEVLKLPFHAVRRLVPDRYTIVRGSHDPSASFISFFDYVCGDIAGAGVTIPGQMVTTEAAVPLVARDIWPGFSYYLLWHGSSNLRLVAALRSIGLDSVALPHAISRVKPDPDLTGKIDVRYAVRKRALAHRREAVVGPPATGSVRQSITTLYAIGSRGEVRIRYWAYASPSSTGSVAVTIPTRSRLHKWIPAGVRKLRGTAIGYGSWSGYYTLLGRSALR